VSESDLASNINPHGVLLLCAAGFDDGDLRISAMQLKMFLDEAVGSAAGTAGVNVPFDALRYTAGECNYGNSEQ
jgi:hypothetical protein